jgi:hypothetical protein
MTEGPLIGLGRRDVGLVHDDQVDIVGLELRQEVIGIIPGAQRVEVRDQDIGVE